MGFSSSAWESQGPPPPFASHWTKDGDGRGGRGPDLGQARPFPGSPFPRYYRVLLASSELCGKEARGRGYREGRGPAVTGSYSTQYTVTSQRTYTSVMGIGGLLCHGEGGLLPTRVHLCVTVPSSRPRSDPVPGFLGQTRSCQETKNASRAKKTRMLPASIRVCGPDHQAINSMPLPLHWAVPDRLAALFVSASTRPEGKGSLQLLWDVKPPKH
ncbi:hypothetical protein B0T18DRAFT_137538 [Schizothecium vesticola]|uniref:Uncharacterized protein n=1 Tax=Schizothecium vesticola TaxID=314040 RepID=A0AA40EUL1_9PEZI|nr:hypothetical protein B0T18DRAFT_137538 [Schizothecium vesticola]